MATSMGLNVHGDDGSSATGVGGVCGGSLSWTWEGRQGLRLLGRIMPEEIGTALA